MDEETKHFGGAVSFPSIYERIERRLIELEKRAGELEHQLKALEELEKQLNELEHRLMRAIFEHRHV